MHDPGRQTGCFDPARHVDISDAAETLVRSGRWYKVTGYLSVAQWIKLVE